MYDLASTKFDRPSMASQKDFFADKSRKAAFQELENEKTGKTANVEPIGCKNIILSPTDVSPISGFLCVSLFSEKVSEINIKTF